MASTTRTVTVPAEAPPVARPKATTLIDPAGRRTASPREHLVRLTLELGGKKVADVSALARRAFQAYGPVDGGHDRREFQDLIEAGRAKAGVPTSVTVGVEARVAWPERPDVASIETLRATLVAEGYRVSIRERRECAEASCFTDAVIEWDRLDAVPAGWFSSAICGRHDFRRCPGCTSIYRLTSTNAAGQAHSVHCEVCGGVLVEWGSSKLWEAHLVVRGEVHAARPR